MMYLLTKNRKLNANVSATFTGAADTGNIIDGDLTTNAETANRNPNLSIDLGVRKVIDALWLAGRILKTTICKRPTTTSPIPIFIRGKPW